MSQARARGWAGAAVVALALPLTSCSAIAGLALNSVSGVFAEAETVFRSDDDLELVGDALAFNLKTLETLLVSSPENEMLLLSAAKAFLLYAYVVVEPGLFELDFTQFEERQAIRRRAGNLYRRGLDFGLRGLEVDRPGFAGRVRRNPATAVQELEEDDAAMALWTGTAMAARVALEMDNPEATADLSTAGAILGRVKELDDLVDRGAVYDYLSLYEALRPGGSVELAREYYERAMELGPERLPVLWTNWAESGAIAAGDRSEFETVLQQTLDFDLETEPDDKLLNRIAQLRAAWLLENIDDYFYDEDRD